MPFSARPRFNVLIIYQSFPQGSETYNTVGWEETVSWCIKTYAGRIRLLSRKRRLQNKPGELSIQPDNEMDNFISNLK